jgi:hypothetical protein
LSSGLRVYVILEAMGLNNSHAISSQGDAEGSDIDEENPNIVR